MANQDNPYDFTRVWAKLHLQGWHSKRGPNGDYFIKPGKDIHGVEGVDYLYGEAAVSMYGIEMGLFEGDDDDGTSINTGEAVKAAEVSDLQKTSTENGSAAARDEALAKQKVDEAMARARGNGKQKMARPAAAPRQWPDSHPRKGRHVEDAISLLDSDDDEEELEDGELQEEKPPAVVEPKVEMVKEEDVGETKRPSSAGKRKGLYMEDDDDGATGYNDIGNDVGAMDVDAAWVENDDAEGDSSTRPNITTRDMRATSAGKEVKKGVHVYRNNQGHVCYTGAPMMAMKSKPAPRGLVSRIPISIQSGEQSQVPPPMSKRALKKQRREAKAAAEALTTKQNAPPQQPQPPQPQHPPQALPKPDIVQAHVTGESVSTEPTHASARPLPKRFDAPLRLAARKYKAVPRGLIPPIPAPSQAPSQTTTPSSASEKPSNNQDHEPERAAGGHNAVPDIPARPASTHTAEEERVPEPEEQAMKPEPEQEQAPVLTPLQPTSRPVSGPPSIASSPKKSDTAHATVTSSQKTQSAERIVRLDVDGVAFKAFPDEKYRVVITEDPDTSEMLIEMEERTTKVQMQLTYSDISKFSQPPESVHAIPLTPALVYQALSLLLKRAGETITVDNPPLGVTTEDDGTPFADFDMIRENASSEIVMEFPKMSFLRQVHRFPMALLPESPRVQAVLRELERTKQDLEAAGRDIEAFKKQHELLEREHQKLRHEHQKLHGEHLKLGHEHQKLRDEQQKLRDVHKKVSDAHQKLRGDHQKLDDKHQILLSEHQKLRGEHLELGREHKKVGDMHQKLRDEHTKLCEASEQQQRQLQSRASTPSPQPTANPPRVVPTPVVGAVPGPSPRAQDLVAFHGQSSWLGTALPDSAEIASLATWPLKWERIVESSGNHFEVLAGDAASTVVKFIIRGSYQLNLNVLHETNRRLVASITSTQQGQSRELNTTSVQVIQPKNKTTHRSRIDQMIQCEVNDTITIQLQSRRETDVLHGDIMALTSLKGQANKWLMLFIDPQFLPVKSS